MAWVAAARGALAAPRFAALHSSAVVPPHAAARAAAASAAAFPRTMSASSAAPGASAAAPRASAHVREFVRTAAGVSVILRAQLDTLGYAGQEVVVAPGFARNHLIPKGLAVYATAANKAAYKVTLEGEAAAAKAAELARNRLRARFDAISLAFQRATSDGVALLGAVTPADIVEQLAASPLRNLKVKEGEVKLSPPGAGKKEANVLSRVGRHTATIDVGRAYPGMTCPLTINVTSS
jgi:large subunit ribosomal protein L9